MAKWISIFIEFIAFYFYSLFPVCLRWAHQSLIISPLETSFCDSCGTPLINSTVTAKCVLVVPHQLIRKLEVTDCCLPQHRMFWHSCLDKAVWGSLQSLLAFGRWTWPRGQGLKVSTHVSWNSKAQTCIRCPKGDYSEQSQCQLCPHWILVKLVKELSIINFSVHTLRSVVKINH